MWFYWLLIATSAPAFIAGLARVKVSLAPFVASVVIVVLSAGLILSRWAWAAQCWDCADGTETRSFQFAITTTFTIVLALAAIGATWTGAGLVTLLRRRRQGA